MVNLWYYTTRILRCFSSSTGLKDLVLLTLLYYTNPFFVTFCSIIIAACSPMCLEVQSTINSQQSKKSYYSNSILDSLIPGLSCFIDQFCVHNKQTKEGSKWKRPGNKANYLHVLRVCEAKWQDVQLFRCSVHGYI